MENYYSDIILSSSDKIYGKDQTMLMLSENAENMYNNCYSCTIIEHEDLTYTIIGAINRFNVTAQEINELLEDLAFEEAENSIRTIIYYSDDKDMHPITIADAKEKLIIYRKSYPVLHTINIELFKNIWNRIIHWIEYGN